MANWIRNSYDKKLSYESLMNAHRKSKKQKGYRKEVILFELKKEEYIKWLYEQLKNRTYQHGGYTTFYITEPKLRKIEKSRYMDRIVHRWLVDNILIPAFVPQFITTSYACIQGRGMHKSCLDLQNMMRKAKRNWKDYYILKMDVKKYFENINKEILCGIVKRKIKDPKIIWLIEEIVYAQKRKKGLEIGNYTSQMFANIYLNEIDQYIKQTLKVKYYSRYMDDSVVLCKTKEEAKNFLEKIQKFLKEKLELELNHKTQIFKNKQGVNYCGYKIRETRIKIRDKGKKKLKKKVQYLKKQIKHGKIGCKEAKKYLVGHIGYIQIADINNLVNRYFYTEK